MLSIFLYPLDWNNENIFEKQASVLSFEWEFVSDDPNFDFKEIKQPKPRLTEEDYINVFIYN